MKLHLGVFVPVSFLATVPVNAFTRWTAKPFKGSNVVVLKANGFEKIQYSNFYAGVGYTPLVDPGADAQTFRESSELCHHPSPIRETETVPRGKILANGFPGGVYESFHDGIGYVPCTDVGADAQKFTPADVLMDHS